MKSSTILKIIEWTMYFTGLFMVAYFTNLYVAFGVMFISGSMVLALARVTAKTKSTPVTKEYWEIID